MPLDSHAEPLVALVNAERDRLSVWLSDWAPGHSVEDERARLRSRRAGLGDARHFSFLIEINGELAGTLGFVVNDEEPHAAEIGDMLAARFEGRGIVTRAVATVIDTAIHRLAIHRFEIRCDPANTRSTAVAQRLGFRREALLRDASRGVHGFRDTEVYALLAPDWRSRPDPNGPLDEPTRTA